MHGRKSTPPPDQRDFFTRIAQTVREVVTARWLHSDGAETFNGDER